MNKELLLDLSGILDEETFHEYVSKKLNFPAHYGYNLDAFWDCVMDDSQSTIPEILVVEGLASLKKFLPDLHDKFVACMIEFSTIQTSHQIVLRQGSPSGEGVDIDPKD
ncbi:TPA: barstar family protein [Vibrio parahaemolyticus]|uniref:barstar family protein n=1 Tax=Vibrio parahaemolyticus TaxID=670 RepID=UPI001121CCF3|nr:barstar family protein [Vibrio parahaemolyticus]EHK9181902.1 barstar family protein [Vibrio parahaemolyticus]EIU6827897.1 barstar family protein [Vibrio parahaemolyticus]EJG0707037.1 barstar family protein [Vibrio parahaemolyticus]MBE4296044.1 barstar family protein [Vibrio parahaemolyticus]TOP60373.1 hypothetical protein CGH13_21925 [Vibrio parahaemolyticus]